MIEILVVTKLPLVDAMSVIEFLNFIKILKIIKLSPSSSRGRMISQLSSFRNNHAFATPLFFNVRLPAFATFLLSQPHAFATIFLLSQPFCLFGNVKKSSFRNKVLVSQQKSPRFATISLVSQPSPRFATTKSSFRNNFPRFATLSKH